jgi:uncharacterized paraquat-inducible protein A
MNNYEEDEDEIWEEEYPKKIASAGTYTSTATSGSAVADVFGQESDLGEIIKKRDKKKKICKSCDIDFPQKFYRCPICNSKLEEE